MDLSKDDHVEKITRRLRQQEEILVQLLKIVGSTNRKLEEITKESKHKELSYLN